MKIEFNATKHVNRDPALRVVEPDSVANPPKVDRQAQADMRRANQGRFAWSKKHGYLGCDPQWHELWVLLIPAFGCSCKQDFADYCKDNPPDFSSPTAYWLWGVHLHNWVNRKLGKTELTVDEAKAIWRREDGTKQGEGMGGSTLQQVSRDSESNVSEATSEGASRSV
jgi:hypothetical protein